MGKLKMAEELRLSRKLIKELEDETKRIKEYLVEIRIAAHRHYKEQDWYVGAAFGDYEEPEVIEEPEGLSEAIENVKQGVVGGTFNPEDFKELPGMEQLDLVNEDGSELDGSYNLTKVSERFRALEDGRHLSHKGVSIAGQTVSKLFSKELTDPSCDWSLVPLKRKAVTKLWVYQTEFGDIGIHRSEQSLWTKQQGCLGAIEGSELEEGVEV